MDASRPPAARPGALSRRRALATLGLCALPACRPPGPFARPGLRVAPPGPSPAAPAATLTPVELVLASTPEALVGPLTEALLEVAGAVERRGSPLDLGLDDDRIDAPLGPWRPWAWPAWTAARALAANRHVTPGGDVVEVVAADAGAVPVWDVPGALDEPARWRLAAWPVGRALWLRAATPADALALAASLRARLPDPEAPHALVIDQATLDGERGAAPDALTAVARRLVARSRGALAGPLGGLVASLAGPREARRLPFLSLTGRDVLLVPRQGQLARPEALRQAARAAAGSARVWSAGAGRPELRE